MMKSKQRDQTAGSDDPQAESGAVETEEPDG